MDREQATPGARVVVNDHFVGHGWHGREYNVAAVEGDRIRCTSPQWGVGTFRLGVLDYIGEPLRPLIEGEFKIGSIVQIISSNLPQTIGAYAEIVESLPATNNSARWRVQLITEVKRSNGTILAFRNLAQWRLRLVSE